MILYLKEAARSLLAEKQRSLLALLGIMVGVGAVIALVSVGQMVSAEAASQFRKLGTQFIRAQIYLDESDLNVADLSVTTNNLQQKLKCLSLATMEVRATLNSEEISAKIIGSDERYLAISGLKVEQGREVSRFDNGKNYVVLGAKLAEELGRQSASELYNREVMLGQHRATVVGILAQADPISSLNLRPDDTLFTNPEFAQKLSNNVETGSLMRVNDDDSVAACLNEIKRYYLLRYPALESEYYTAQQLIEQLNEQTRLLDFMLLVVAAISLLMGGVGIMNVMLMSVAERKQEIGIRRALGAKRDDVRLQFMLEALLLCVAGGVLGSLLGVGAAYITASQLGWQFITPYVAIMVGAGISILIGLFFGFLPASQAAKLEPIKALRGD